ncbi:MAG: trypsin-like peptidase domain-containing protein, partial [Clostridia bacterium]|nr:trypsin-like peptidase domain-containing protein [Clostridia bacterium]
VVHDPADICDVFGGSVVGAAFAPGAGILVEGDAPSQIGGISLFKGPRKAHVITCAHVIDDYEGTITVHTFDEQEHVAEIVGYDVKTDVGLLRIHTSGYDLVEIGDSDELKVGDPVYAVGNPDGMQFFGTFSIGHITALNRKLTTESGYEMKCIQHDATVNPGNSGGMLVNGKGEVIGINSSKWVKIGFEGMDFAVPINDALEIIDYLMEYGYVPGRPKLGFRYISIYDTYFYAPYYYKYEWPDGSLVIMGVDEDSDLVDKGLHYFDVITEVNGQTLDDEFSIVNILNSSRIGDTITLKVLRAYSLERVEEFTVTTTLIQDRGSARVIELPDTEMDPETTEPETTRRGLFGLFGF